MQRFANMAAPHWLGLYGAIAAAWIGVWLIVAPPGAATWLADICFTPTGEIGLAGALLMWLLMSAAMMLPTVLPALATYDDLVHAGWKRNIRRPRRRDSARAVVAWGLRPAAADAHPSTGAAALIAGYVAVWVSVALLAAAAQVAGAALGRPVGVENLTPAAMAAFLAVAGLYQFSPMKAACLSRCRAPLTFFMAYWHLSPFAMGVRLGAVCLGCCWALMLIVFAGGMTSLAAMAVGTLVIIAEKLDTGTRLPHALGFACLAAAGYLIGGFA